MATLDDIKAVLEGIRKDLSGTQAKAPTSDMSERDMRDYVDAVKAHTEALEKQIEATEKAARAQKELDEGSGILEESFGQLTGKMGKAGKAAGKYGGSLNVLGKMFEGVVGLGKEMAEVSFEHGLAMDKATASMQAQTGAGAALASAMRGVIDSTIRYGVTARDAEKASIALYGSFSDFAFVGEHMAGVLMRDAVILEQVGLSFQSFADIAQLSSKLLGNSLSETSALTYQVRSAAISIGMPIDEFARKLVPLTENLAGMGDGALEAAASVLRLHRETGMAVDAITGLDDQMYTFEGATKFAQRMNQALGGNFFDPHSLMTAFDHPDGPVAVARLVKSTFAKSGADTTKMGRRALRFIAGRMKMQEADFRKLMENQISEDAFKIPEPGRARATAEEDAMKNMKSAAEYSANMRRDFLTMPMQPIVEEMHRIRDLTHDTSMDVLNIASNWKRSFVEIHKTKLAMLMFGKILYSQNEALLGSIGAILAGALAGVAMVLRKGAKPILSFFTKTIPAAAEHLFVKFGSQLLDFGKLSKMRMAGALAGVTLFADGAIKSIANVYTNVTQVIKEGGTFLDQMTAASLGVMKGFGDAIDFVLSGFGLLEEGLLSRFSRLFNPGGKSFVEAYLEIDWSYLSEGLDESLDAISKKMGEFIYEVKDIFKMRSPSLVFVDIGENLVRGLLLPFDNLAASVVPIMQEVMEVIPSPIRSLFEGGAGIREIATAAATANQNAVSGIADALNNKDSTQTIEVSFQLDGREVDRKILSVVGGIVQPLTT